MQSSSTLLAGVAFSAIVAGGAWYGMERTDLLRLIGTVEAAAPAQEAPKPVVDVVLAETRTVTEWDEFTGRFQAVDEVSIQARVSGYLDAVHFQAGTIVEEGELLFTIDPRPFEIAVADAEARLAEAKATVSLAEKELERSQRLQNNGHASQSVVDTDAQKAESAAAGLAAAEAAVARAKLDLGFTQIHAPVTGRISDNFVSPGNLIAAGASSGALTTIVSLDPIHFTFDATEQEYLEAVRELSAANVRKTAGQTTVEVRLIDEPEFTHSGSVDFIDNRIDLATGTIRARAVFDNPEGVFTPGMFGQIRVATSENESRVLIPERAIGSDQSTKFAWVVDGEGTVSRRDIKLRERRDALRAVEGIEEGEQVIVSGLHMVGPGAKVIARVIDEQTAGAAQR